MTPVHAHAAVEAVLVPLPIGLAILGLLIAIVAILWAGAGIRRATGWISSKGPRFQAAVCGLLVVVIGVVAALAMSWNWLFVMRPYKAAHFDGHVLAAERERALKPLDDFRECAKDCPEMVVIPAGHFMMGAADSETSRQANEDDGHGRQHEVTIARPFAVAKFNVKSDEWIACVEAGGCPVEDDFAYANGQHLKLSWNNARAYADWLSQMTGKTYRLVTEAEWEYAARAGRLYDTNASQWVEDCYHENYDGAPTDGSAWTQGRCDHRMVRGNRRVAWRKSYTAQDYRGNCCDVRVARTLAP